MTDFMNAAPEPRTALGRHRVLSSTAGIHVSPLALGAMSIGDAWSSFMGSLNKKQAFELLDAFYDAGGNLIDTANDYQNGQSETWIGDWMAERKNREEIVIATKYSFHYRAHTNAAKHPGNNNFWGNSKRSLQSSFRDSLKKLQTDWVDVLYIHFWDYMVSVKEVMDSLHALVQQGKVLYLGVSDTPAWVVAAANEYALTHGKTPFSIYQGLWNVLNRDLEREVLPMAIHYGMAIAPWGAIGQGKLQSEEQLEARAKNAEGGARSAEPTEEERKMSQALSRVAKAHNIKSVTAVALAYLLAKVPNVIPVVGGRKVEYLQDNIQALDLKLTNEEIEYLEGIKEWDIGFPGNFIGQDWRVSGKLPLAAISQGPIDLPQ